MLPSHPNLSQHRAPMKLKLHLQGWCLQVWSISSISCGTEAGSWEISQRIPHRCCTLGAWWPPCSPIAQVAGIQAAAQTRLFAARLVLFVNIFLRDRALGIALCHYKQVKLSVCLSMFSTLKPGQFCSEVNPHRCAAQGYTLFLSNYPGNCN